MNFTISKPMSSEDIARIDKRFLPFLKGWSVSETYENNLVTIPAIIPFNYYQVTDKPASDIQDNELELSLWCGWPDVDNTGQIIGFYDAEAIINLRIQGSDVLNIIPSKCQVVAEITKQGGAAMQVYYNRKQVTDFTSYGYCYALVNDKATLVYARYPNGRQTRNMSEYL